MTNRISESNIHSYSKSDLHGFLHLLQQHNDLITIDKQVSPKFELAAISHKLDRKQAILFQHVEGSGMSVVTNILGTRKRFSSAIGTDDPTMIHSHILESMSNASYEKTIEDEPPFCDNSSTDLNDLPIIMHFEKDAGHYITSSIVYAKDQERENQNSSIHRFLRLDRNHMVIRMVEGRHLHKCYSFAKEHGEDLRVTVAIGVHPAISIASAYQAAYGFDEMILANSLLKGELSLSKSDYSGLYVPTFSEIILEGRILQDETAEEWMVEMLKTYDIKRQQPVFELDRIKFRNNAYFHDILPGFSEHRLLMGLPVEARLYEGVKNVVSSTKTVHLSDGGSNWLTAIIQIHKRLEGESKNALLAAFANHPSLKIAIVVDDDIDPTDAVSVEYAISTRCQADKGLLIIPNAKGSSLDPSSDQVNLLTTKLGIDATVSLLKDKERFEIAHIPGEDNIDLSHYMPNRLIDNTK
jgi:anhydromevalonate phosphate decarboxylase